MCIHYAKASYMPVYLILLGLWTALLLSCQNPADPAHSEHLSQPQHSARNTGNLQIPLIVVLYDQSNFQGAMRIFYKDEANLAAQKFNDQASSMKIFKGPSYEEWKSENPGKEPLVTLCKDVQFGGSCLSYGAGAYAHLSQENTLSSLIFNDSVTKWGKAAEGSPIKSIDTVTTICRLYSDKNFSGDYLDLLAGPDSTEFNQMKSYRQIQRNDYYSSVYCQKGPQWSPQHGITFYVHSNWNGDTQNLGCRIDAQGFTQCDQIPLFTGGWNDAISSHKSF